MKSSQTNRNERPIGIYVPKGRRRLNDSSSEANCNVNSIDMMQELSICSGSDNPSREQLEGNGNNKITTNDNNMTVSKHNTTVFNDLCSDGKVRQGNVVPRIYNTEFTASIGDSSAPIVADEVMSNNVITPAQETMQQNSSAAGNDDGGVNSKGTINVCTDISTSNADTKSSTGNHHVIRQSDRPIGIYIPKGRRQLLKTTKAMDDVFGDDSATYDDNSSSSSAIITTTDSGGQGNRKKASSAFEMIHSSIVSSDANSYWSHRGDKIERVSNHCTESSYDASSSSSGADVFDDDEYVSSCCMTLIGLSLSTELSDVARNSICSSYVSSGGIVKWMSSHDCLVVYRSEKSALSSMAMSNSASGQYKLRRLRDNLQMDKDACIIGNLCSYFLAL
jgi:hypothetical protein